ncbi:MAG: hypothetical protein B5M48_02780 [Candidatus Omnitrophica bacterium 4484_213]|nr:MAG: hypothetical protein B5M48_02780 [Candidatus Omnitrophica bacterium 4484_213]
MKIDKIYPKLNEIKSEIESLKILILERYQVPKQWISLRGMGKVLVSENELEYSIKKAKKSLFKGDKDVLSG